MNETSSWLLLILLLWNPDPAWSASGCCSRHGGVAGCAADVGRAQCADGVVSPSCACQEQAPSAPATKDRPAADAAKPSAPASGGQQVSPLSPAEDQKRQDALKKAQSLLNTPYQWGGQNAQGTDCSGLINQAYPDYFASSGHLSAAEQYNRLEKNGDENLKPQELESGDVVYWTNQKDGHWHAGIVENVDSSGGHPYHVIAASSSAKHKRVRRDVLRSTGDFGSDLHYKGGGRPR